ncbi:MAG: KpsF/GutQ family sugar-phosphate isomerase [Hyphomicrobiales bacterium]|nr:KpsF/GutQ family sugar-phosphate isomerase [Hyphomicrobiales bacterium]
MSHGEALGSALRTVRIESDALQALMADLAGDTGSELGAEFGRVVALLRGRQGRVIVTGMGKSGHIARKLAATFSSTGTPAHYVHPAEASHGDLGMIQSGDAILALSWSGETAELADIILYASRFDVPLVAITAHADSALGRAADHCLILPLVEEACPNGLAPTSSTTLQLVLGDALALALLEARGFTAQDFRQFHPGGKLGARLLLVRDVMLGAPRLPLVAITATMAEAVMEITGKGVGCVGVVDGAGRLVGIITDGDLRRHMCDDLMMRPVTDVMTPSPRTVQPTMLSAEALQILEARKITALFVVDAGAIPQGVVHIHDLLARGVA